MKYKTTYKPYTTYHKYKSKIDKIFRKVLTNVHTTSDCKCIEPNKHGSLELNADGYWRLRYTLPDKWIQNKDGNDKIYKLSNGTTRRRRPKTGFYLHHLILLYNNIRIIDKKASVKFTISHTCGNSKCFNIEHLTVEPHRINLSRNQCHTQICIHSPKCLRSRATVIKHISAIIDQFKSYA